MVERYRPKRRIMRDFKLSEISAVDFPAQKGAKMTIMKKGSEEPYWKRDFSDKERQNLADQGKALPDGSYPIENTNDLHNAIQAFGRAKNKAQVKRHIISRARALGATDALPDDWNVGKALTLAERITLYAQADNAQPMVEVFKGQYPEDAEPAMYALDCTLASVLKSDEEQEDRVTKMREGVEEFLKAVTDVWPEADEQMAAYFKDMGNLDDLEQQLEEAEGKIEDLEEALVDSPNGERVGDLSTRVSELSNTLDSLLGDLKGGAKKSAEVTELIQLGDQLLSKLTKAKATVTHLQEVLMTMSKAEKAYYDGLEDEAKQAYLKMSDDERRKAYKAKSKADMQDDQDEEDMQDAADDEDTESKKSKAAKGKKKAGDDPGYEPEEDVQNAKKRDEEVLKVGGKEIRKSAVGAAVFDVLKAQQDEITKARETAENERELRKFEEFKKQAEVELAGLPGKVEDQAEVLKAIEKMDEAPRKTLHAMLKAGKEAVTDAFKALGVKAGQDVGKNGSSPQAFNDKVSEIMKRDSCSRTEAFTKARKEAPEAFQAFQGTN